MAIVVSEKTSFRWSDNVIELQAGENLKLEIGEDEFSETVPEGKIWTGSLSFNFVEPDAPS